MQKGDGLMSDLRIEGKIRQDILKAAHSAGKVGAHIAPSLSLVEICLTVLSGFNRGKDTFVLSKAHGALGYYATMYKLGMISEDQFNSFEENGGEFPGQPSRTANNNIDYSSGSLGMGLSYAAGKAWGLTDSTVYVILGDGELDEGSNWEAASVISKNKINNVIAVVDCNGLQSDGRCDSIQGKDLRKIWEGHGWNVVSCDGHNTEELKRVITDTERDAPVVILAKTTKGKGVSFMEDNNEWHHHELNDEQFEEAMKEVALNYGL